MRLAKARASYQLGKTTINFTEETVIMGILNVTPDSFSDGGRYGGQNPALEHARQMLADGAKIIDIGGESTRPGYTPVSAEEELARVVPVIELLTKELGCVLSIDTSKAAVAEAAVKAGASIINDVWGAKREPAIAEVAARYGVPIILMHNRDNTDYQQPFMEAVLADLQESIEIAKTAGVSEEMIWLDPGIGFAKDLEQNIQAMQGLSLIADLGYPVLLGTSRKGMIGKVLDLPVNERVEGTGATVCYGIEHGGHIMRVHDVKEIARMVKMMDVLTKKAAYTG
ncbi:dihydropteroate synthase [Sporosarcina sp. P33]|uniref:dihydropteroate synthase n=1 Tax=Sporosarcina sp. P33 TaxID=1930764 RepID=UPI0009C11B5F|nr:dihydropteroate synthase [Sporosarcina sp. P33]ARD48478.1 dihydropteroate synthase [Sporosarcina sp. P33]